MYATYIYIYDICIYCLHIAFFLVQPYFRTSKRGFFKRVTPQIINLSLIGSLFFQMESDVFVAGRKLKRSPRQAPEMSSFSATYPMLTWDPMGDIWWSKISAPWLAIDGWFPSGDIANNGWVEGLWQLYVMLDEVNQMGTHPCTGKCVLFD